VSLRGLLSITAGHTALSCSGLVQNILQVTARLNRPVGMCCMPAVQGVQLVVIGLQRVPGCYKLSDCGFPIRILFCGVCNKYLVIFYLICQACCRNCSFGVKHGVFNTNLLSNGNRTVAAWNPIIKSCIFVKVVLKAWCTPFGSHCPVIFKRCAYVNLSVLKKKYVFINMLMYFKVYVTINIS